MDVEIKTDEFIGFLQRIKLGKLVNDGIIFCDNAKLHCHFATPDKSMYAEIYETVAKTYDDGSIMVISLEKLIAIMQRFVTGVVRIAARENIFIITDGKEVGKSNAKLTQNAEPMFVESYSAIMGVKNMFDREKLCYVGQVNYKNGFEVTIGALQNLLKDSKAFGFEIYQFYEKEGILSCKVKTKMNDVPDSFTRKIPTVSKIGGPIKPVIVSIGFREIIDALSKTNTEEKKLVKVYFEPEAILITDHNKYFYNLNSIKE